MRNLIALVALSAILLSLGTQAFADEPEVDRLGEAEFKYQPATQVVDETILGAPAEADIVGLDVRD
jgi:hypothetical protein